MKALKKLTKTGSKVISDFGDSVDRGIGKLSGMAEGKTFLHGYLLIRVEEARNIPDMENWYSKIVNSKDVTDPFVDVKLDRTRIAKTRIIDNDLNPKWDETFNIAVCHKSNTLIFDVRDKDHAYTEEIGQVELSTQLLLNGQEISDWFDIRKNNKVNGQLKISVTYKSMYEIGESYEVDSYFPMHRGCNVVLYQDAHCPDDIPWMNMVQGPPNIPSNSRSCWKDLYYSIRDAKHLICITGWSVWTGLYLFRGQEAVDIYSGSLGELLCEKADEGVQIYVMVWSEKSSGEFVGDEGVMGTHDMETYKFFKNKANYRTTDNMVRCALAPRELHETNELTDVLQNQFGSSMYTHHQKSVIVDAGCPYQPDGRRVLHAYVGGLDLTGGRYDNPNFELFSTLLTDHRGDFRNSNAKSTPADVGPREPWHDIHSRVEGPIATDVLQNFIERWRRQGTREGPPPALDYMLCKKINPEACSVQEQPDRQWNVQFFRSITSDSADFDPEKKNNNYYLSRKKGKIIEHSIATAYIQMIRNAQNFIYIENQYFMGSAYEWDKDSQVLCNHTIPAEIVAKIVDKIRKGERFTAYIVIPMWPEGDPTSGPMQAILHWQKRTMEMMYRDIGNALRDPSIHVNPAHGSHPQDYLLFLCPGKREGYGSHIEDLEPPPQGSLAERFREVKRQMIYVHSKMIIIDDAYILVGSANINERSMAGTRDTEMAVGCWQPQYTAYHPYGDVHVFRMKLWAAFLRHWEELFRFPGTLDCTRKVKEYTDYNWRVYNYDFYGMDEMPLPPGLLLTYPVKITPDGMMQNLDGFASFPDYPSTALVFGSKSNIIPEKITT
eukprot:TRINITY_DN3767_c0_g1_i10.p1 TRINITY_DN3767_c0_g1~~TRINITY_DN3767_c0_g1_i10.p1  ORF type:complete len:833 (-),score=154.58 TRINITY_DN3767_c0_g1_i10:667-3165(-)